MAKSTKGARRIVVQNVMYRWRATGTDNGISVVIWPADLPGPTITCSLDYHHVPVPLGEGRTALTNQIVVTNRIVRKVVEHAITERHYDPSTSGQEVNLRAVDDAIDLSRAIRSA